MLQPQEQNSPDKQEPHIQKELSYESNAHVKPQKLTNPDMIQNGMPFNLVNYLANPDIEKPKQFQPIKESSSMIWSDIGAAIVKMNIDGEVAIEVDSKSSGQKNLLANIAQLKLPYDSCGYNMLCCLKQDDIILPISDFHSKNQQVQEELTLNNFKIMCPGNMPVYHSSEKLPIGVIQYGSCTNGSIQIQNVSGNTLLQFNDKGQWQRNLRWMLEFPFIPCCVFKNCELTQNNNDLINGKGESIKIVEHQNETSSQITIDKSIQNLYKEEFEDVTCNGIEQRKTIVNSIEYKVTFSNTTTNHTKKLIISSLIPAVAASYQRATL